MEDVPRPERDEQRAEVLDQERDPDGEPVDREEVEPLHEREPADPEERRGTAARARARAAARGAITSRTSTKPDRARRSIRTSSSRSDETSEPRITFETVPLIAQSVAADAAIAYPTRGRRCARRLDRERRLAHGAAAYGPRPRAYTEPHGA